MSEALAITDSPTMALSTPELINVLRSSLYPGASDDSIKLVLGYCAAAKLDPMQKPVHIVPMWNRKSGREEDVIMPGIGLYRTQASRSDQLAGIDEPEFGEDVTEMIGGVEITYPKWCRVTVRRRLPSGDIATFTAKELWKENYAVKGGKERSIAPNAMWMKRPYGQISKCAQAQALRQAFPEMCSAPTAEEMEGKSLDERPVSARVVGAVHDPSAPIDKALNAPAEPVETWQDLYPTEWESRLSKVEDQSDKNLGLLWSADRTNPALCAWAADWIVRTMADLPDCEWSQIVEMTSAPDTPKDCTPADLWKVAGYLRKQKAAMERLLQEEAV